MSKLKYSVETFIDGLVDTERDTSLLLAAIITQSTSKSISDRDNFLMRMYYNWYHLLYKEGLERSFRAPEFREEESEE